MAAETVLLRNIGKSEIHTADPKKKKKGEFFKFMPNSTVHFSKEQAEKLRRLYPKTVVGQEQALDPFKIAPKEQTKA